MKESKTTITDWLQKYGDPEVEKYVERQILQITKCNIKITWLNEVTLPKFKEQYHESLLLVNALTVDDFVDNKIVINNDFFKIEITIP